MKLIKSIWHYILIVYYQLAFITGGVIDDEYYLEVARQWMDLDKYRRAIRNLEMALKTYDVSSVRYNLAWCYQNTGEYEKACINYDKAHEKHLHPIYKIYFAYCKNCLGKKEESIKIMNELKEIKMDESTLEEFNRINNLINNK
jgi:tetratricopeptide (TPR) repeat protein